MIFTEAYSVTAQAERGRWSAPDPPDPSEPGLIRLAAVDVDGTLLRSNGSLSRRSVEAVVAATRRGVKVVLATARPPRSTRKIYEVLGLDTLLISYNGAMIYDLVRKRHVLHLPLAAKLAQAVVKLARRVDPQVVVNVEVLDKWYTDRLDPSLPLESGETKGPDFVGPLTAVLHVPATKLMFLAQPQRIQDLSDRIQKKFGTEVAVTVSDHHILQVMHPQADKGIALSLVAAHYQIRQGQVMAIGDAPNDVGMLRWAGVGVAVENSWPQARQAADMVVPSNDDDGAAFALRQYRVNPFGTTRLVVG